MSVESSPPSSAPSTSLRRNAIGLPGVLFQSITTMAPASAVAFSLGAARAVEPRRADLRRVVCPGPDHRYPAQLAVAQSAGAEQQDIR